MPFDDKPQVLACLSRCILTPLAFMWAPSVFTGVSVGYFDTEDAAARAYDRAAIGLLGRTNCKAVLNFPIEEYDNDSVPELVGESNHQQTSAINSSCSETTTHNEARLAWPASVHVLSCWLCRRRRPVGCC
jgi:hypothetical protein